VSTTLCVPTGVRDAHSRIRASQEPICHPPEKESPAMERALTRDAQAACDFSFSTSKFSPFFMAGTIKGPVPSGGRLVAAPLETDDRLSIGDPQQDAWTETPSFPPLCHTVYARAPGRDGSSEQVVGLPVFCSPARRSRDFPNRDFRCARGRVPFGFSSRCRASRSRCHERIHSNWRVFSYLNAVGYHRNSGCSPRRVTDGVPTQNTRKSSRWLVAGPCSSLCARRGLSPRLLCGASLSPD